MFCNAVLRNAKNSDVEAFKVSDEVTEGLRFFCAAWRIITGIKIKNKALTFEIFTGNLPSIGVWVEKKNYGKTYMGIERSTFLIDSHGIIQEIWRKVRVPGHVEKVLEAAKAHA